MTEPSHPLTQLDPPSRLPEKTTRNGGDKAPRTPRFYTPALALSHGGVQLALLTPVMVSMAFKLQHITDTREAATGALGMVLGIGALFALFCNPLAGRLSDRTTSRWGMRRPWILGGAVVGLLALILIGAANTVPLVLVGWCLAQSSFNVVLAAANATVPDQVPTTRRGRVSGIIGIKTPIAILVGSFLVNQLADDFSRFVVPGVTAAGFAILFVIILKDRRLERRPESKLTLLQFLGSFVFNPRKYPDFGWTWLTKLLIFFGYAGIATFLPLYLATHFNMSEKDVTATILAANFASMIMILISSPLSGLLSDRIGKRRIFVTGAGMVMVIGLVTLAFAPNVAMVVVAQGIVGLGFGAFTSVDLALATQVLPNKDDAAKDLGVLNIANSLPQSIAPAIAPMMIAFGANTALGGYTLWYLFGAVVALTGSILVYRIKGVK